MPGGSFFVQQSAFATRRAHLLAAPGSNVENRTLRHGLTMPPSPWTIPTTAQESEVRPTRMY